MTRVVHAVVRSRESRRPGQRSPKKHTTSSDRFIGDCRLCAVIDAATVGIDRTPLCPETRSPRFDDRCARGCCVPIGDRSGQLWLAGVGQGHDTGRRATGAGAPWSGGCGRGMVEGIEPERGWRGFVRRCRCPLAPRCRPSRNRGTQGNVVRRIAAPCGRRPAVRRAQLRAVRSDRWTTEKRRYSTLAESWGRTIERMPVLTSSKLSRWAT
jgi:hypothetical protein